MTLNRTPVSMLLRDDVFLSRAAAEAADPCAPLANLIYVVDAGEVTIYRRQGGATDLIAADLSTWAKASVDSTDLAALAGDLSALFTGITYDNGSFVPALSWSGGGGGITYTTQNGRWSQIGNHTRIDMTITANLGTLGTGNLRVGGLSAGQLPVVGDFPGYLDVVAKSDSFFIPYGASDLRVSWTGGSSVGVFTYYSSAGYLSQYVTGLAGASIPRGDYSQVTWSGGYGRLIEWQADPTVANAGRMIIINVVGNDPTGTITGTGFTATAAGVWSGARPGERFLSDANFAASQDISFTASGWFQVA